MLKKIMIEITKYKYFGIQRKRYSEVERFNERGYEWTDTVNKTKLVEVELHGPEGSTRKQPYKIQQSLYYFLQYINTESKKSDIEKALNGLQENLKTNKKETEKIKSDERYTDEYKQKLINDYDEDTAITVAEIERLNSYIAQKENKKEIATVKRVLTSLKKEVKEYINEKWKYNEAYIEQVESKFIDENPLFNFTFEIDKVLIEEKRGLAKANVKADKK